MYTRWRIVLTIALLLGLAVSWGQMETTWAQPHQSSLRDSINTRVPTPTDGPTSTGTPTAGPCVQRILLQEGVDGYSGTWDTWIYAYLPYFPQPADGALKIKGADIQSVLTRFDLQGMLPPGAEVIEAELVFYVDAYSETRALDVAPFRLLRAWEESSATWDSASTGVAWAQPGCNGVGQDRVGDPDDTITLAYRAAYRGFDVTSSVRYWQQYPAQNHGWLIKGDLSSTAEYVLASSRSSDISRRPVLRIDYAGCGVTPTATPEPTGTSTPDIHYPGSVKAFVFGDLNRNQVHDAGEQGLAGALILLLNSSKEALGGRLVDASGYASFDGLAPGLYRVQERNPWGYRSSTEDEVVVQVEQEMLFVAFGDYPGSAIALPVIVKDR